MLSKGKQFENFEFVLNQIPKAHHHVVETQISST